MAVEHEEVIVGRDILLLKLTEPLKTIDSPDRDNKVFDLPHGLKHYDFFRSEACCLGT
jgi:predicted metalloenzyme YecM